MNIYKLIDWAEMVRFHLKTPQAPDNQSVSAERLTEKLAGFWTSNRTWSRGVNVGALFRRCFSLKLGQPACFDCRISQLPTAELVVDYFRWRNEDAGATP